MKNASVIQFFIGSENVKHGNKLLSTILSELGYGVAELKALLRQQTKKQELARNELNELHTGLDNGNLFVNKGMPLVDASAVDNETSVPLGSQNEALASASQSITIDAGKYYDFGSRPLIKYTAVTPDGTEDPSDEGWYVEDGDGGYELTDDATVDSETTYYEQGYGSSGLAIFPKAQVADHTNAYSYTGRFTIDENYSDDFTLGLISARKNMSANVIEGDATFTLQVIDLPELEAGHTYEFNILFDTCIVKDITPASE